MYLTTPTTPFTSTYRGGGGGGADGVEGGEDEEEEEDEVPSWLPQTFCLPEEIEEMIAYFTKQRIRRGRSGKEGEERESSTNDDNDEDELWIVKPPHLARGWDIIVTSSLPCILRHLQVDK